MFHIVVRCWLFALIFVFVGVEIGYATDLKIENIRFVHRPESTGEMRAVLRFDMEKCMA